MVGVGDKVSFSPHMCMPKMLRILWGIQGCMQNMNFFLPLTSPIQPPKRSCQDRSFFSKSPTYLCSKLSVRQGDLFEVSMWGTWDPSRAPHPHPHPDGAQIVEGGGWCQNLSLSIPMLRGQGSPQAGTMQDIAWEGYCQPYSHPASTASLFCFPHTTQCSNPSVCRWVSPVYRGGEIFARGQFREENFAFEIGDKIFPGAIF